MSELLLELGTEELPASAVRRAYTEFAEKVTSLLIESGLVEPNSQALSLGTPRRLIVSIPDVRERQEDSTKEQRGPGLKAAYNDSGEPTQALLGFCKSQGVDPSELRQDGQYVWVTKKVLGRSSSEILSEALPKIIRSLTFDKTMRWGSGKMRFARPIRWMLAVIGGKTMPFEMEGVASSDQSCGHRFYAPESFAAHSLAQLVTELRNRKVEPDPVKRRAMILDRLPVESGDHPELPEALIEENVFLTEWPTPIVGTFESDFLELPAAVLSTVMAKHEKMFPIKDDRGQIKNRFIFVRNSGEDESVRKGCAWVLNARMNDAKFFFDEDRKTSLQEFHAKTAGIVFQEKLGNLHSRSERLSKLAAAVCPTPSSGDSEIEYARVAGELAKADLATGLVSELASLQGIVGGIYAKRDGQPDEVAWAISSQYDLTKNSSPEDLAGRTAVRLVMADQLDKLAGYLGIGLEPSGSSDPYGLRRAVGLLIEAAWNWPGPVRPFSELFGDAVKVYEEQGIKLDRVGSLSALGRMFAARYAALLPGVRHDILAAALREESVEELTNPKAVQFRIEILSALSGDEAFVQTATRPLNIVSAAVKKGKFVPGGTVASNESLDSESGSRLLSELEKFGPQIRHAIESRDLEQSLILLRQLQGPINEFFEGTMVMAEDPRVRDARLGLLDGLGRVLSLAGDFNRLVFEGDR